jgi:beta-glucosidase
LFRNFDNIGMQCGGWTVRWQGFEGNDFWKDSNKQSSNASSILDALKSIQAKNNVNYL